MKRLIPAALLATFLGIGCGDDTKTTTPDASVDSSSNMAMCTSYCTCMTGTNGCMNVTGADGGVENFVPGGNMSGCMWACLAQTNWDLACRIQHCGFVMSMPGNETYANIHCPHTIGMGACTNH